MESIYVKKLLEKKEVQKTFCPYRVCPLGAHIDHQHGIVTGFALDKGIEVLYVPDENGICRVSSANMDGRKEFSIHSVMPKVGDWADHFRGTVQILQQYFELNIGIEAYIIGSLPIG
jgi:galactokinase/galacturonokinase